MAPRLQRTMPLLLPPEDRQVRGPMGSLDPLFRVWLMRYLSLMMRGGNRGSEFQIPGSLCERTENRTYHLVSSPFHPPPASFKAAFSVSQVGLEQAV